MSNEQQVLGRHLREGDLVKDLWIGDQFITSLKDYTGACAQYFDGGARIASLSPSKVGITIGNTDVYTVIRSQVENSRSASENTEAA